MKKSLITICMLFVATITFSQYTFSGKVIDEDGEPIIGAIAREANTENATITNLEGEFTLTGQQPQMQINVSFVGLIPDTAIVLPESEKFFVLLSTQNMDQEVILLHPSYRIKPVFVSDKYPVTKNTSTQGERESINLGQDIPVLLDQMPSVVTTSDAGAGVGYTGIRVRGSDASRVNVTINGIPLNDSESQGVFWVNMPDFASSTGNITLVRGVGTSTNGAGAFGASLHLETEDIQQDAFGEYNGGVGSFNTWKNNIEFGTGEQNGWSANGRLSKITSDGFIDRASSDLQSYFLQAKKEYGENYATGGSIKFVTFKGHEETYQAWFGVREDILATNRRFNPYTYENQVDDYSQEHFQLLANQGFGENLRANIGLHYTIGRGFFEEFREQDFLGNYGITSAFSETSDLVRRRWLDNDFYGFVGSLDFVEEAHYLKIGGGYNRYLGDHFGEVIQGEFVPQTAIGENYYFNDAQKNDGNIYAKYTYDVGVGDGFGVLRPFVDLQYRTVDYDFVGLALNGNGEVQELPQNQNFNFFNPKVGLSYENDDHAAYLSFARAQKEPNRSDFVDSPASLLPVPEELNDFELGYSFGEPQYSQYSGSVNLYYMDYKNQLAVTGGVNDVGQYTRVNVDDSYRAGIELVGNLRFGNQNQFAISANTTLSQNKINSFTENLELYDENFSFLGFEQINHQDTNLALSPNVIAGGTFSYTEPDGLFSVATQNKYVGEQFLDNTSTNSRSIDAYYVNNLNATVNLRRLAPQLKRFELNVLVNNVFDAEYESNGYTFGYEFAGDTIYENYYYPQAGTNFLTGLKVKF